jgi:hypothetical protein
MSILGDDLFEVSPSIGDFLFTSKKAIAEFVLMNIGKH